MITGILKNCMISAVILLTVALTNFALGQGVGVIPVVTSSGSLLNYDVSSTILFVDGDRGEIISFSDVEEFPMISHIKMNERENRVYVFTKHYGYQFELSTGAKILEYQAFDLERRDEATGYDLNTYLMPLQVSADGVAYYNVVDEMTGVMGTNIYKVDLRENTTELLASFDGEHYAYFESIDSDTIRFYNPLNLVSTEYSLSTGRLINRTELDIDLTTFEELNDGTTITSRPVRDSTGIYTVTVLKYEHNEESQTVVNTETFALKYDDEKRSVVSFEKIPSPGMTGNTSSGSYYQTSDCNLPPMPTQTETEMPKWMTKKRSARYLQEMQENTQKFMKELEEWQKLSRDVTRCSLSVYRDEAKSNLIVEIPAAKSGAIYSDNIMIVNNKRSLRSYDLQSGTLNWSLNIEF